ncbi:hypothetical protein BC940DRAFT_337673 [Gongronella butleri]|nr:hypothetical protein BC940DRAFT_337673 [Gongronella butleri]
MSCAGYINDTLIIISSLLTDTGYSISNASNMQQLAQLQFPDVTKSSSSSSFNTFACAIAQDLAVLEISSASPSSSALITYNYTSGGTSSSSSSSNGPWAMAGTPIYSKTNPIAILDGIVAPCSSGSSPACFVALYRTSNATMVQLYNATAPISAPQTIINWPSDVRNMTADATIVYNQGTALILTPSHLLVQSIAPTTATDRSLTAHERVKIRKRQTSTEAAQPTATPTGSSSSWAFAYASPIEIGPAILNTEHNVLVIASKKTNNVYNVQLPSSSSSSVAAVKQLHVGSSSGILTWVSSDASSAVYVPNDSPMAVPTTIQWAQLIDPSLNAPNPSSTGPSAPQSANGGPALSVGAIVGVVIGCVAILAIGLFLVICCWRRKLNRYPGTPTATRYPLVTESSVMKKDIAPQPYSNGATSPPQQYYTMQNRAPSATHASNEDNMSEKATAITAALIKGLVAAKRVQFVGRGASDLNGFDPMHGLPVLTAPSGNVYELEPGAAIHPYLPGYILRTARNRADGRDCTVHYLLTRDAHFFARNVEASQSIIHPQDVTQDAPVLLTVDALALEQPTQQGYQYIWITTPYTPEHTMQHILFDVHARAATTRTSTRASQLPFDPTEFSFKAWTTLSLLRVLHTVHGFAWVHRNIHPSNVFYPVTATDWAITGFDRAVYTRSTHQDDAHALYLHEYTAPEIVSRPDLPPSTFSKPSIDIWALGMVLYTLATGKKPFDSIQHYNTVIANQKLREHVDALVKDATRVDAAFGSLLAAMLTIAPDHRDTTGNLIQRWITANQLEDE